VDVHPPNGAHYETSNFTYGIFSRGVFTDYYGGITRRNFREILDPSTGIVGKTPIDLPVVIEPCQKIVIWTYLKILDGNRNFNVDILVAVNSELA
jgi:hypothetical protein